MSGRAMHLAELLPGADAALARFQVTGLTLDSRRVAAGDLFLALSGGRTHGAAFIAQALERGAAAIAVEADEAGFELCEQAGREVPLVRLPGLGQRAGVIADRFFGHPSRALRVIGVTGTNGKSSVTHFIADALSQLGPCGLIGTLGSGLMGQLAHTGYTTPDPVTLHRQLAQMRDAGAHAVVMEVSSHALDQGRVNGVAFEVAAFTNLTHDHLDYHGDMESYAAAKRRLLQWPGLRGAAVNLDDPIGLQWFEELSRDRRVIGFGLGEDSWLAEGELFRAHTIVFDSRGLAFTLDTPYGTARIESGLMGRFNVSNLLATAAALVLAERPFEEVVGHLKAARTVPGRMERFEGGATAPVVVVDYAHTPDALEQVLRALRDHLPGERRLWCVFGCGGDRDRGKRPLMGRIAESRADFVILTDDNPRSEQPAAIIQEIRQGMRDPGAARVIHDRAGAIRSAVDLAGPGDIVLVAGMGHETGQTIGDTRLPHSDRAEVARILGVPAHG